MSLIPMLTLTPWPAKVLVNAVNVIAVLRVHVVAKVPPIWEFKSIYACAPLVPDNPAAPDITKFDAEPTELEPIAVVGLV